MSSTNPRPISVRASTRPISARAIARPISTRASTRPISARAIARPISTRAIARPISARASASVYATTRRRRRNINHQRILQNQDIVQLLQVAESNRFTQHLMGGSPFF
jgi:hypothetical protein